MITISNLLVFSDLESTSGTVVREDHKILHFLIVDFHNGETDLERLRGVL